jgi:DNA-directed RNA polymerase subunit RPC12/RpoP
MATTIEVEIACARCGSALFALPKTPPQADDLVCCADCGEYIGTYEAVRARAKHAAGVAVAARKCDH